MTYSSEAQFRPLKNSPTDSQHTIIAANIVTFTTIARTQRGAVEAPDQVE